MPNFKRYEYRGYRLEVTIADSSGWTVTAYRLASSLPAPLRGSSIRYLTAERATNAGRREVDMLLAEKISADPGER